jgi:hypothetical protein
LLDSVEFYNVDGLAAWSLSVLVLFLEMLGVCGFVLVCFIVGLVVCGLDTGCSIFASAV